MNPSPDPEGPPDHPPRPTRPPRGDRGGAVRHARDPEQIIKQTQALANAVHTELRKLDLPGSESIEQEARRWADDTVTVVVAGEVKRGKSSLINALLGSDILPVDVDIATAVPIAVTRREEGVRVTVTRFANGESHREEIDEVDFRLAATASAPYTDAIAVSLENPVTPPGITVIDTPGVGGLSPGHRDLTLSAVSGADALIVVMSAVEPPTRAELDFLAEVTDRIDRIMVVASRADLHPPDRNEALVEELRSHLRRWADAGPDEAVTEEEVIRAARAERLRGLADQPIALTSAHLARQARRRQERGQAERAAELRARSGIGEIAAQISGWSRRRVQVRNANLLRLVDTLLAGAEDGVRRRVRATGGDLAVADELRATLAQLEEVAGTQARWRQQLSVAMQRLQTNANRTVTRHLNGLRVRYEEVIGDMSDHQDMDLAAELERSIQAAWIDLVDQLNAEFTAEVQDLGGGLELDDLAVVLGDLESPDSVILNVRRTTEQQSAFETTLPVVSQSYMFGNLIKVGAGLAGVATGGLGMVAYGIGAAAAVPLSRIRRQRQERKQAAADLLRSLNEALFGNEGVARELNAALSLRLIEARIELEESIDARLAERRRQVEAQKSELEATARLEATERKRRRAELKSQLDALAALRGRYEKLAGA